jgi:hypothetical protein
MQFIPFKELKKYEKVIGVDCFHPHAFCLSHWRGAPILKEVEDDTSAAIVLNAIKKNIPELSYPYVTNNHFDVDGFVGIWSLLNKDLALDFETELRYMALIGDFRELDAVDPVILADVKKDEKLLVALKLVCWMNSVEKNKFYPPFGAQFTEEKEAAMCVDKFDYFLTAFSDVLLNPQQYKSDWEEEYNQVVDGLQLIEEKGEIIDYPEIKLQVVKSVEPSHYYTQFAKSAKADMVLSIYDDNRYELEYKYTTWIDTLNRKSFPRTNLDELAAKLNAIEKNEGKWEFQKITDTGPILAININSYNKEKRYNHPCNRKIFSSSITPDKLIDIIVTHYNERLKDLSPRKHFSWEEVKSINRK